MKKTVIHWGVSVAAFAAMALLVGCARGRNATDPPAKGAPQVQGRGVAEITVRTVLAASGALVVEHQTAGTVKPVMLSQVVGQVSGAVVRVAKKAGEWVDKDDVIVQLDDSQLKLSVRSAQAAVQASRINLAIGQDATKQANPRLDLQVRSAESALSVAQRNYDARKALFDLGGATSSDLDRAKSDLDMAQANLEAARTALDQNRKAESQNIAQLKLSVEQADATLQQAQLNLQRAAIKAPYAGRLVAVNVMPGELVSQNAVAFILASEEQEVDFDVPPADAPSLPVGAPVSFELNGIDHPLKVSQSPDVPLKGVVHMVAAAPGSRALSFGAVGTVRYPLTLARGTLIPLGALQTNEDRDFAYVVEGGKALVRQIAILAESGNSAAVKGVNAGDAVVVDPPPGFLDGTAVRTLPPAGTEGGK